MKDTKKLLEVALPLTSINAACSREKSIRHGHPSTLRLWWARRPLAAARAVIFAQMVDDPLSHPDIFRTEKEQEKERQRLFGIIEELVQWENTTNEEVLERARTEIRQSWRATCANYAGHQRAKELFDRHKLPAFYDPFSGGGSLPLEAQWLGLEAYASDLNPVAVLITKAMIEIPPKFAGGPPVNPDARIDKSLVAKTWHGAEGWRLTFATTVDGCDTRHSGGSCHLYPSVEVTAEMVRKRPDLKPLEGRKLAVIAWLWARTVKSPNPAFAQVDVPLASTFMLSTKVGKEAFVELNMEGDGYAFMVKLGKPNDAEVARRGTKLGGSNFRCIMSGAAIDAKYIRSQAQAGRMDARLMAVVVEGERRQIYLSPRAEMEVMAKSAVSTWKPELMVPTPCHDVDRLPMYGMPTWGDAFTPRQLGALATFSELVQEAREQAKRDALAAGPRIDDLNTDTSDAGAAAYADAVALYLGLPVGRSANYWSAFTPWGGSFIVQTFSRQAIRMIWDYAEGNPFSGSTGNWSGALEWIEKVIETCLTGQSEGSATQADAQGQRIGDGKVVSTDPPYYDNVAYADLSDFFYVWLRHSLGSVFPRLFATLATPKAEELVASPYRHGGKEEAEKFFLNGMTLAMRRLAEQAHPAFPVTIYYAFKQSEGEGDDGAASTGWEIFLDAVMRAGFALTGTWPMRTERDQGLKTGTNVLASSIILVCRPRAVNAPIGTRRDFVNALKAELPQALAHLQRSNIAPVDLAQASIGPGIAVYTRYSQVLDADGKPLSAREALALINQTLDEVLTQQDGDLDAASRWAVAWFEQSGFADGEYGVAEILSKAKNTAVDGMVEAGIVASKGGRVRLLKPDQLPVKWDPTTDAHLTAWEMVHQLIRALEAGGEGAAGRLLARLGAKAEIARELAYRLYTVCERKKRATEALSYNGLVQSWPEIARLAREVGPMQPTQGDLLA